MQNDDNHDNCDKKSNMLPSTARTFRIFISYGHDEYAALCEQLKDDLTARGHHVWFDAERLKAGVDWERYIEEGIDWVCSDKETAKCILVMTPHSVRRPNGYCLNELARLIARSVTIIPIMAVQSEPPLSIFRLQYLDMQDSCKPARSKELYEQRLNRLIKALEEDKRDFEGVQSRLLTTLSPISFDADINKLLSNFTGRHWVIEAVDIWLKDLKGSKVFWIKGPPGVGKSSIAAWLRDNRREVVGYHFCDVNHSEKSNPSLMVLSLAYQLSTQLPDYQERLALIDTQSVVAGFSDAYTLFDKLIVQPLANNFPDPDRTVVIIIDALDEASHNERNEIALFLSSCSSKTPDWLRFLVTSRPDPEITTLFQSLCPLDLDTAEARSDITQYFNTRIPHLTEADLRELVDRSDGVFLYANHVCEEIDAGRLSLDRLDQFPRGLGGVYTKFFLRQFSGNLYLYNSRVRSLLCVCMAARQPLERKLLRGILGYASEMELQDTLRTMGSLFEERGEGDTATIVAFHRSLNDWLLTKELSGQFHIETVDGHSLLADHGWQQFRMNSGLMSAYYLEWLPTHLLEAQEYEKLRVVMKDFDFMMARTTAGFVRQLLQDYEDEIVPRLPQCYKQSLKMEVFFFHLNAMILRRHSAEWPAYKTLVQLAIDHADDSSLTAGAERFISEGKCDWIWLKKKQRPPKWREELCENEQSSEDYLDGFAGLINWDEKRYFCWGKDGSISLFSAITGSLLATERQSYMDAVRKATVRANTIVTCSEIGAHTWQIFSGDRLAELLRNVGVYQECLETAEYDLVDVSHLDSPEFVPPGNKGCFGTEHLPNMRLIWCWDSGSTEWVVVCWRAILDPDIFVNQVLWLDDYHLISCSDDGFLRLIDIEGEVKETVHFCMPIVGASRINDQQLFIWTDMPIGFVCRINPLEVLQEVPFEFAPLGFPGFSGISSEQMTDQMKLFSEILHLKYLHENTHKHIVEGVVETKDDRLIAWFEDGSVAVWSTKSWQPVYPQFEEKVSSVGFRRETTRTAHTLQDDGVLRFGILWKDKEDNESQVPSVKIVGSIDAGNDLILSWGESAECFLGSSGFSVGDGVKIQPSETKPDHDFEPLGVPKTASGVLDSLNL